MQEDFAKLKLVTKIWLESAKQFNALRAVNLGLDWHTDTRKDGITPEFTHQLSQIQNARGIAGIAENDLETIICVIALHDLPEDKKYGIRWVYSEFGDAVGLGVERMSKKYFGENADQSDDRYYYDLAHNKHASIAKGCDRVHNQSTMIGILDIWKYMDETEKYVLPMLKAARKNFGTQGIAYTTLRHRLKEQNFLIREAYKLGGKESLSRNG